MCTTQSIPTSAINSLQNIKLNPVLAKLSMASTSTHYMIYLPKQFSGAGFKRWSIEILAQQISLLTNQMESHKWTDFVLQERLLAYWMLPGNTFTCPLSTVQRQLHHHVDGPFISTQLQESTSIFDNQFSVK